MDVSHTCVVLFDALVKKQQYDEMLADESVRNGHNGLQGSFSQSVNLSFLMTQMVPLILPKQTEFGKNMQMTGPF